MSTRIERPAVEEFMRLRSIQKPWGMVDVDALALCKYALALEAEIARKDAALRRIQNSTGRMAQRP